MRDTDTKTITWPQDTTRVNIEDPVELQFWAQRLHVSRETLKRAVSAVGSHLGDVEPYLNDKRS